MNSRAFLLAGASIAVVALLAVLCKPQASGPGKMPPESPPAAARAPVSGKAEIQPPERPLPFARAPARDAVDLVQEGLREWREAADPQTAVRRMKALIELLNDRNVVRVIYSLSIEDMNGPFGNAALERWLNLDPAMAIAWMTARPEPTGEQITLVAKKLLEVPDSFQSHLDRLPDGNWKEQLLGAAGFEVATRDPVQAIVFAEGMQPGEIRTGLLRSAAFEWARRDPVAMRQWVGQVSDPALQEQLAAAGAKGCASTDPRQAAEWLVSAVKNKELLREAAPGIVRSWAASEPAAAAEWVARFPEGAVRDEALENLVSLWSASDPSAAASWLQSLPDESLRRKASEILARDRISADEAEP